MTAEPIHLWIPDDEVIIAAGQRAWAEEKFSKERRLHRWHEIGKALLVGRELHPDDNNAFGAWCATSEFGDIKAPIRSDAIWLARNWDEVVRVLRPSEDPKCPGHPQRVRKAFNKATGNAPDTSRMTETDAEYIRKLDVLARHPGTPEHEAASAAAKRDEMVARYNVDLDRTAGPARYERLPRPRRAPLHQDHPRGPGGLGSPQGARQAGPG